MQYNNIYVDHMTNNFCQKRVDFGKKPRVITEPYIALEGFSNLRVVSDSRHDI